jgi:acyl transferase domain-containing protein
MSETSNDIAIVGMACRFPGAPNTAAFWKNLCGGVESVTFFTKAELAAEGVPSAQLEDPDYVRAAAVLPDIDMFDAGFFGINPREAEIMDPQHRVFLECAWEALEQAGYDSQNVQGRIGLYAGTGISTYLLRNLAANRKIVESVSTFQLLMGNSKDYMPTRTSYKLNLRGPSMNISTACSTSLVSVHMACQSLLDYHCDMALAGGAGIQVPQKHGYLYETGGILSADGHCRAFDAEAGGTVNGSGAGIVVLKRLDEALVSGDRIYAVIKGSAVNNDGSQKVGFTAPSVDGQAEVIAEALALAEVEPEQISYVETHGTGTALGDPIEMAALTQAFRSATDKKQFCAIGSVKTNFGHLDEAAGVAGLIKTVLALWHGQIPPSLHFRNANSKIDFANSPFRVNTKLVDWQVEGGKRRAGVSSFGIGGTNAHVVLEEAPVPRAPGGSRSCQLVVLSARTDSALAQASANLADYLDANPGIQLADMAYTLGCGRRGFAKRKALVCASVEDTCKALRDGALVGDASASQRKIGFMFSGQGSQHVNMGLELYRSEPVFSGEVDRCCALLQAELGFDLRTVLYPEQGREAACEEKLRQTAVTQPALFVIEYALAKLWESFGVKPDVMVGHSIGEYTAACMAGVLTLEAALRLVAIRGRMMQSLPGGAMLAVGMHEADLQPWLGPDASIGVINGPEMCVVSGTYEAVDRLEKAFGEKGILARKLMTSHAFHSVMMEPVVREFVEEVKKVPLQAPSIPYVSNVSGTWITEKEATDPAYWGRHLRQTVRFGDALGLLLQAGDIELVEVGPGKVLVTLAARFPGQTQRVLNTLPHPQEQAGDLRTLLGALGRLWANGARVDWNGFYAGQQRNRLDLPTYPFERQRYWIEPDHLVVPQVTASKDVSGWFHVPEWQKSKMGKSGVNVTGPCLVFDDETVLGAALMQGLTTAGCPVVTVKSGASFIRHSANAFTINPAKRTDYDALVQAMSGSMPGNVIQLWGTDSENRTWEMETQRGFYSLLFLAQALGAAGVDTPCRILVVTSGMQDAGGSGVSHPARATVIGPVRVMPMEYPHIKCASVDVDLAASAGTLAGLLMQELALALPDTIVAYRGIERLILGFVPSRFRKVEGVPARLKQNGTYMITGGLGSMGLAFAEYLATTVSARLVLIGRTALPPQAEWEGYLTAQAREGGSRAGTKIIDLETESALIESIERVVDQQIGIKGLDAYPGVEQALNEYCSSLVVAYFQLMGIAFKAGSRYSRAEIISTLRLLPKYEKLLDAFLRMLCADGLLTEVGATYEVVRGGADARKLRVEYSRTYPEVEGIIHLLATCAQSYGQALRGEVDGISVLYPDGSRDLFEACDKHTVEHSQDRVYMVTLGKMLSNLAERMKGRSLRILEVGGGSGGLTTHLLEALAGFDVEYHFTDIGRSFVVKAQKEAEKRGLHAMKFDLLDISKDPEAQGFRNGAYDVVVGYNVVHATRRIDETVDNLGKLLTPGGLMCLVETVKYRRWDDLIWGLTDGWWYFDDVALRGGSPLLGLDRWEQALDGRCFQHIRTYPAGRPPEDV